MALQVNWEPQHSTAFESMYANIPGIKVVSPSNPYDAKGLLKQAIRYEGRSRNVHGERADVWRKNEVPRKNIILN